MTLRENEALSLETSFQVGLPRAAQNMRWLGILRGRVGAMMDPQPDDLVSAAKFHLRRRWPLAHANRVVKLDGHLFDCLSGDVSRRGSYFGVRYRNCFSQGCLRRSRYRTLIGYGIGNLRHEAADSPECQGGESTEG
jgi:hypothetical protein